MYHYKFNKNKWTISVRYSQQTIMVEITDDFPRDAFVEIISLLFKDYPSLSLSQYIDTIQCKIENLEQFSTNLSKKYKVEVETTQTYTQRIAQRSASSLFVLNIFGPHSQNLLSEVLIFEINNLANIIYGVRGTQDDWLNSLLRWNKKITDWFNLKIKEDDPELIALIKAVGLAATTIDGHIFLWFADPLYLESILNIIEEICKRHHAKLEVKTINK